jgi:hypothetical protein
VGSPAVSLGPGDRMMREEFLCLGLCLNSLLFVSFDLQKSRKNFQLSSGCGEHSWFCSGVNFVLQTLLSLLRPAITSNTWS